MMLISSKMNFLKKEEFKGVTLLMQNKEDFLGTEPIGKLLFRLSIPTVVAQLINMLYNIVDRIYIGHIPDVGSLALTGVGVCMPIIMIVSACRTGQLRGRTESLYFYG